MPDAKDHILCDESSLNPPTGKTPRSTSATDSSASETPCFVTRHLSPLTSSILVYWTMLDWQTGLVESPPVISGCPKPGR